MSKLPEPTVSATVTSGAITARVKRVRRWRRRPADVAPRGPKRYRADRSVRGKGAVVRAISAPEEEWRLADEQARQLGIARSELVRRALRAFASSGPCAGNGAGASAASSTSKSEHHTPSNTRNTNRR